MTIKDIAHVSNAYINRQDLEPLFSAERGGAKHMWKVREIYARLMISYTPAKIRKLARPQNSGNAKRAMWFYFARNGFVKIPPKNYCEIAQPNPPYKDINLKGVYVRRCRCGKRPYSDRIQGYSWWIECGCGMRGHNGNYLDDAIMNWNKEDVYYNG